MCVCMPFGDVDGSRLRDVRHGAEPSASVTVSTATCMYLIYCASLGMFAGW